MIEHAEAKRDTTIGRVEFIALLAFSMALTALGMVIMLPALAAIRTGMNLSADSTAVAGLATTYFLGMATSTVCYGPIADRFGRRRALYVGFSLYAVGALAAAASPSLPILLASRFLWGLGAAGARVVTIAMIRDEYEGEKMAQLMSMVMAVFFIVPMLGPSIGAAILAVSSWRWVFLFCFLAVGLMSIWAVRLPETLSPEHRLELRADRIVGAARVVVSDRLAGGYGLAQAVTFGPFASYLASSEIIFGQVFDRASEYPIIYGGLAGVMCSGVLLNARIVGRFGTRRVAHSALTCSVSVAALMVVVTSVLGMRPPLWLFVAGMAVLLAGIGLMMPNFNALSMTNMGKVAGTASSLIAGAQIGFGSLLGSVLDQAFDGTVRPLMLGFFAYGAIALGVVFWAERGVMFAPVAPALDLEAGEPNYSSSR